MTENIADHADRLQRWLTETAERFAETLPKDLANRITVNIDVTYSASPAPEYITVKVTGTDSEPSS